MKINTTHICNKVWSTALMMLCCMALFSCVEVDLCEEPTHEHLGNVKLVYHWPDDIPVDERPDSMFAFIDRAISTHRIGYVTNLESSVGGRYLFGKVHNDTSVYNQQPLMVRPGEYRAFAINKDVVDNNTDYRVEHFNKFFDEGTQSETSVRDLYISYVPQEITTDWIDFNPYSKYIATDSKPIYGTYSKDCESPLGQTFSMPKDGKAEVYLDVQKITQDITISFPIYTEYVENDNSIYVDSIIAEISGIPYKMLIHNRTLMIDTTYKMLFKMDVDIENAKDTVLTIKSTDKTVKKVECKSKISVMGLVANKLSQNTTGAGILQLCIHAHTYDKKKKTQHAKINLYNTIHAANLVITDDWGRIIQNPGTYPELPLSKTLRIDNSFLVITRDFVLNALNNGNSLDTWLGDKDGDGEVDDDDHKLEVEM